MMRKRVFAVLCVGMVVATSQLFAQRGMSRQRDMHEWEVKAEKMRQHLQPTMRQHGVDMWIIMSRENHPDPAIALFGANGITGWYGHRNAYIFYDPGEGQPLETVVFGTHLSGFLETFYDSVVNYGEAGLKPLLSAYVQEKDPQTIAINQSRTISMADGLTACMVSLGGLENSRKF